MNRRHALTLLLSAAPLAGCMQPRHTGTLAQLPAGGGYVLATGDKLRIIVFGQDTLSNIYQVDASGRVSLPLIGPVAVAGLSTGDAASAIEGKLKAGYVREPKVTVEVDTYRPFFILGEVTTSGQFSYVNGMTVQTAVAIAGGFTARANRDVAELTRRTSRGIQVADVPVTSPVRPGDTIVIKERWF